ncbi:MAG: glycosyltransferase family 4 protein [Spirochaetia bacterium]|nr:glycosyltransferase family 4 protein [Spirochaetia bacterium]
MRVLRIGVDARPLSSRVSGVARVITNILRHYPDHGKGTEFLLYSAGPCHRDHIDLLDRPNIKWVQGKGALAWKQGLWFNSALPLSLRHDSLNVFWGSQQVLPPLLPASLPAVLTFYDLVALYFPGAMRRIARIQQKAFLNYSVRRAARILCISDQSRVDMIRELNVPESRAGVALLGADIPPRFSDSPRKAGNAKTATPYILAVSTLEPRKNYGMLLDAYADYAAREQKPLRLVIAGRRGWETPEFYLKLANLESRGLVKIEDSMSDEALHRLYAGCAFFVMPSLYEGFGLPLLEAMSHGKFGLVSDLPCFHEIGAKQARYLPARDSAAWSIALSETTALSQKKKLPAIKWNAKDWSWEKTARIHADAFASVARLDD